MQTVKEIIQQIGGWNVTEGDIGGLHFFDVTEHPVRKNVEITGKNRADHWLHWGVRVTGGQGFDGYL